jgi:membrane-bound inhibitor of C-type lysozyme
MMARAHAHTHTHTHTHMKIHLYSIRSSFLSNEKAPGWRLFERGFRYACDTGALSVKSISAREDSTLSLQQHLITVVNASAHQASEVVGGRGGRLKC